jgi:hypothetical protein
MEAKWSQSRVLPSAELAYETCLSAGSIAMMHVTHPLWLAELCPRNHFGIIILSLQIPVQKSRPNDLLPVTFPEFGADYIVNERN